MSGKVLKFPTGFFWGASTSAHQVEGGNTNDWSEWEKKNSRRLAKLGFKRLNITQNQFGQKSIFSEKLQKDVSDPKNYISGIACDTYNRYEEDFDIAKSFNHNAHRLSIEWSRIEPKKGRINDYEIEHYRSVLRALTKRNLEPFVTLHHFTNPLWIRDRGGWENPETAEDFAVFAGIISEKLGKEFKYWTVLNEPQQYALASYSGWITPGKKSLLSGLRAIRTYIKAHNLAAKEIKKHCPDSMLGIAKTEQYFEAYKNFPHNILLKKFADRFMNTYFIEKILENLDFIGLNYYFRNRVRSGYNKNPMGIVSDLGWDLYPKGIYPVLKQLSKFKKPIIITENGLADARDDKREWLIKETLRNIHKAMQDGVDVRGYLHWSLLDNFEWDKGFWPRFGLVEIDRENNLERKPRGSAYKFAEICKSNILIVEDDEGLKAYD